MWTLIYDLFSCTDAPDVTGILAFCWGIASLVIPIFETGILGATQNNLSLSVLSKNISIAYNSAMEVSTSTRPLTTPSMNQTSSKVASAESLRSFGNQMVMAMLCTFLFLAFLCQCVMYFAVIRKMRSAKDDEQKENSIDFAHSNAGFESL